MANPRALVDLPTGVFCGCERGGGGKVDGKEHFLNEDDCSGIGHQVPIACVDFLQCNQFGVSIWLKSGRGRL